MNHVTRFAAWDLDEAHAVRRASCDASKSVLDSDTQRFLAELKFQLGARTVFLLLKKFILGSLISLPAILSNGACAQGHEPTDLIDQQHCMFCHTSDAPFLAPSFHQIAERYRTVPDASVMLEQKLRVGGRAHWGDTPMPLAPDRGGPLSPEDAHTLIQWVMTQ